MDKNIVGNIEEILSDEQASAILENIRLNPSTLSQKINYFMRSHLAMPIYSDIINLVGLGFDQNRAKLITTMVEAELVKVLTNSFDEDPDKALSNTFRNLRAFQAYMFRMVNYSLNGDTSRVEFLMDNVVEMINTNIESAKSQLIELGWATLCDKCDGQRLAIGKACNACNGNGLSINQEGSELGDDHITK